MDDLSLVRMRVSELLDAKITRRAELVKEIESIDAELKAAQQLLSKWPSEQEAEQPAPRRVARPPKLRTMPRSNVVEYLQLMGPQSKRHIVDHFFGPKSDLRSGAILSVWVRSGFLQQMPDGSFAVPTLKLAEPISA